MSLEKIIDAAMILSSRMKIPPERTPAGYNVFKLGIEATNHQMVPQEPAAMLHHACRWLGFHLPVLRPSLGLTSVLVLTDVRDVALDEIKFPFPAFFIEVPPKLGWKFHVDEKWHSVSLVSFHDYLSLPPSFPRSPVRITPEVIIWLQQHETVRTWRVSVFSSDGAEIWYLGDAKETIGEWIDTRKANSTSIQSSEIPGEDLETDDHDLMEMACRLVFGTSLYIIEHGPGKKLGQYTTKRSSAARGAAKLKPAVWVIGADIEVDKEVVSSASAFVGNRAQWTLRKRYVVRGHWRQQVCGAGRKDRRRTFIKPYWKGPRDGDRLTHVYTAGHEDDGAKH